MVLGLVYPDGSHLPPQETRVQVRFRHSTEFAWDTAWCRVRTAAILMAVYARRVTLYIIRELGLFSYAIALPNRRLRINPYGCVVNCASGYS